MVKYASEYAIGEGTQPGVTHGPVQNRMQYDRVKTFFDDIAKQGWEVALGGKLDDSPQKGYYVTPTIIDRPPEKSRIVVEEPFGMWDSPHASSQLSSNFIKGPIVPLLSWKDEADVIDRANDTTMGLGASVWSNDIGRATRVAKEIEAGTVWVNTHFEMSPLTPFGGHKQSGIGCEWGLNGLKAFCNVQTLFVNKALP
jgi:acyl-CoA reductase-like NAD-dependent aldehyde dehydrogenase